MKKRKLRVRIEVEGRDMGRRPVSSSSLCRHFILSSLNFFSFERQPTRAPNGATREEILSGPLCSTFSFNFRLTFSELFFLRLVLVGGFFPSRHSLPPRRDMTLRVFFREKEEREKGRPKRKEERKELFSFSLLSLVSRFSFEHPRKRA